MLKIKMQERQRLLAQAHEVGGGCECEVSRATDGGSMVEPVALQKKGN